MSDLIERLRVIAMDLDGPCTAAIEEAIAALSHSHEGWKTLKEAQPEPDQVVIAWLTEDRFGLRVTVGAWNGEDISDAISVYGPSEIRAWIALPPLSAAPEAK